jgi:hypothetical protein
MRIRKPTWFLLAGMATSMSAAEFAPPAEGPVAFRRDRIPLDVDAIAGLSRQLETLARGLRAESAADRRGAAQMLALALALDPANAKARDLISRYARDQHDPEGEIAVIERSRSRIWQCISWLETPEAGEDGRALAACLKDVILVSDPKHPKAADLRANGENGVWAGWIPELSAYEKPVVATTESPAEPPPETPATPEADAPLLEAARIQTVLWLRVGKPGDMKWTMGPSTLEMTARKVKPNQDQEAKPPFALAISHQPDMGQMFQLADSVKNLLRTHFGKLPRGVRVQVTGTDLERSIASGRRQSISAATAVLTAAAISGRAPEAVIIGQIDGTGAYKLPNGFWDQLRALGKGTGTRLVLPAEAAAFLPSMLALEKPEFFLEYEVLLASDLKQVLDLATRKPDEPPPPASAKFREIRERAGSGDVRQYIANSFVKQRLAAVLQDMPTHVSAKMLLIQASGSRPVFVSRAVAAAELRHAIEPISRITGNNTPGPGAIANAGLGEMYDSCRAAVEGLERYIEKTDRPLIEETREVIVALRTLDRAARTRGESYFVDEGVYSASTALARLHSGLLERLNAEAGDDPVPGRNR